MATQKLTPEQQKQGLENFLNTVTENKELFIYSVNLGKNTKFSIARKLEHGAVDTRTKFMTYEEMNCYFLGVLAVKENRIDF